MKALAYLSVILVCASILPLPAKAADLAEDDYHPFLRDKYRLSIGAFLPRKNYKMRVDGSAPGDEIDFNEAFKYSETEATGSLNFSWDFTENWSLWGQYWDTGVKNGAILEEDVEWGDVVFREGSYAEGDANMKVTRIFFGRTLSSGPQYEFGLGGGLHWLEMDATIEGQADIGDGSTEFYRGSVATEFPFPNIGGWYLYSWSPAWVFQARLDWLDASIGDYSGSLWNAQIGVHWQAFEKIGLGLYYNALFINAAVNKTDWKGKIASEQYGPFFAISASW